MSIKNTQSRKPTFIKPLNEISSKLPYSRSKTNLGQYATNIQNTPLNERESPKVKGKFEDLLNAYFSNIPTSIISSPSKEVNTARKRFEVKEIIQGKKPIINYPSSPLETKIPLNAKSPILKFKEEFENLKRTNTIMNPSPKTIKTARPSVSSNQISKSRPQTRGGIFIKYFSSFS